MDTSILREMGLTHNEITVYLALLPLGPVSVNTIAEKSGLHRQAVYDALDRLLEKGFVYFNIEKNKKQFHAVHPEKVFEYLRSQEAKYRALLPELARITASGKTDTRVEVYKGKNAVRILFHDVIATLRKKPGENLLFSIDETRYTGADKVALEQHLLRFREMGCTERVLVEEGSTYFYPGKQTRYRALPRHIFHPTPMEVYGDNMAIITWGQPVHVVIIRNKDLAAAYRKQFNALWTMAKPVKR